MGDSSGRTKTESLWRPNDLDLEPIRGVYYSDWRQHLNKKNEDELTNLSDCNLRFSFYQRDSCSFFMRIVRRLGLPPEVTYVALDIFDRYCLNILRKSAKGLQMKVNDGNLEACLIAFACLQLASKVCCASQVISVIVVIKWLKHFGYEVDRKTIVTSEMTVFNAVKCVVPAVTILTYVEMFLEGMAKIRGVRRSDLLKICVKVINVTFMFHAEIYSKLNIALKKWAIECQRERRQFLSVEGDSIRLAASVITAATMLADPTNKASNDAIKFFADTTNYKAYEVKVLSQIIVHIILRRNQA